MAVYKAVLNGEWGGQNIENILYYRTGLGIDIAGLTIGGTVDLANLIKLNVWPAMKPLMHNLYTLQDITVYAFHDTIFTAIYQNPTTVPVNEQGLNSDALDGPMQVGIVRFILESTVIDVNGPKPPKRGYLAIGPLQNAQVNDSGHIVLTGDYGTQWRAFCDAVSTNLIQVLPPAVFFPIRVHTDKIGNVIKITSYADVSGSDVRSVASFRRSRMPEL